MAKQKPKSKSRLDSIYGTTAKAVREICITVDEATGEVALQNAQPGSVKHVRSYMRDSGKEKIVSSIDSPTASSSFNVLSNLRNHFAHLIAVDTNTVEISGRRVSATMSFYVPGRISDYNDQIPIEPLAGYVIFDCVTSQNPEVLGWDLVIRNNIKHQELSSLTAIGMIVDSELGKHSEINRRNIPFYANQYLPNYVNLVYSSDKETDTLAGTMIKSCHDGAKKIIAKLRELNLEEIELTGANEHCAGYLVIDLPAAKYL